MPTDTTHHSQPVSSQTLSSFDPRTFVVDDLFAADSNALAAQLKELFVRHIYTAPSTPSPSGVAHALADKVVFGRFKYHDPENREPRDAFNNICYADLADMQPLPPLTDDLSRPGRFKRALVEAITVYFRLVRDIVPITSSLLIAIARKDKDEQLVRPTQASAYITDLVGVVFDSLSGDILTILSAVTKLVAGLPVYLQNNGETWDFVGRHAVDSELDLLYMQLLFALASSTLNCERQGAYSGPGLRWKTAIGAKISTAILAGRDCNHFDVASRAVDIDYAHNVIEGGLALAHPVLGSAIVGPTSATLKILYDIAGCVQERKDLDFDSYEDDRTFQFLLDADGEIRTTILGMEVKDESIVSLTNYFPKGALAAFIDGDPKVRNKVMVSKHGIMLYFPTHLGPWYDVSIGGAENGRDPLKLVMRIAQEERGAERARKTLEERTKHLRTNWLAECPVSEETKSRFGYILNRPGRVLVKRRGLRGRYGQGIGIVLVACGVAATGINFAGRDNWLERVFDGAQAASLLAGVIVVLIFFLTGTLTNTLDFLAGVTEAQDIGQVALLTGLTIEQIQGVLTYARGTLYWLSAERASYCRAVRLGSIVMTPVLDVGKNRETRASLCIEISDGGDSGDAVWVMQGRMAKIESTRTGDGIWHAEEVPFSHQILRGQSSSSFEIE